MLKKGRKLALALIAAGILCGSVAMPANAETKAVTIPADAIASGVVDEDYGQITWYIDADYKLVVSGTGDVRDPEYAQHYFGDPYEYEVIPWYDYKEKIGTAELYVKEMTDLSYFFYGCSLLENINFKNFDTSNVTDMKYMFYDCDSLESLDLSGFDTGNVTDMESMFSNCDRLESLDLSSFNTGNVENMSHMFSGSSLKSLDLSCFDTGNVTDMEWMFDECYSLESLDLSSFDTKNVTTMENMFRYCSSLKTLDLSSFDTGNVMVMEWMFDYCSSLKSLNLSNFDTANVTDMNYMFASCYSLESLDLSSFDTRNAIDVKWMFRDCYSLRKIKTPLCVGLVTATLPLPHGEMVYGWFLPDGTEIEELPKKSKESVTIVRKLVTPITDIFTDVHKDWYTDYVQYVYDNNLMTGIKGTTQFQPNANITKAQVAQVLYNMEGQPNVIEKKVFTELKDVYEVEWYANAVAWAYNNSIVTGDTNTKKFSPNEDVTREQLAIMMYRYAKYKGMDTSASSDLAGLKNAENVSNWALDGVKWAVGSGLISGIEKNGVKDLAPQGNATRAQMAAILQRFCEKE